jgi:hypothetical protein
VSFFAAKYVVMFIKRLVVVISLLIVQVSLSQTGKIVGTIVDAKTGETLPGAMAIIDGTTKGGSADFDGKFSINNLEPGKYTLAISYVSYNTKKITDIVVNANDATNVNVSLDPSTSTDLQEVEVVVTLNKENNTALVLQQKNNASVSDGISAESIKKSPDRNTADVLKRVSGVTIQDDKFVIVRGLNERYNASYLNGSPLPSTEPDRKAFAFDLFPANMIDNIIINKTARPDMPAEFAGGVVEVNTKSIPERNFISISGGSGYNTIATGKDRVFYEGGKLDKLGFDDGSRDLPKQVPGYLDKSTWITTPQQAEMAKNFKNDWATNKSKTTANYNFQLSAGYNFKWKERDFFGVIFSLSNSLNNDYYQQMIYNYQNLGPNFDASGNIQREQYWRQNTYSTKASTGGLLNMACKINSNNTISLKTIISGNSDNRFISAFGNGNVIDADSTVTRNNARFFSANRILTSQLNGEHYLPKSKIKINWNASISTVKRTVPNLRFTNYSKNYFFQDPDSPNPLDTVFSSYAPPGSTTGPGYSGYRVYSSLNEKITSGKLDVSRNFRINPNFSIEGKIGSLVQQRSREFNIRQFGLKQYDFSFNYLLSYLPEDSIFMLENMGKTPTNTGFSLFEFTKPDDNYTASTNLFANYAMAEMKFTEKIRFIAGVRNESFTQQVNVRYSKVLDSVFVKSTTNDLLPSFNFIYNINSYFGIRLAFSKTLNRAELRELAPVNWFDPETRLSVAGNPKIERCYIENYDARFEFYPGRGQLITTSGFYKFFNAPIERFISSGDKNQIEYKNVNSGFVYGGELEYRVNLGAILKKDSIQFLNNLNIFSNLALMKSQVDVGGINTSTNVASTRQMQGQAPYVINGGISYIDNKNNFSITTMVNRVGPRIYLVGSDVVPNSWEQPRTILDFQATKSFLKNRLEIRFNIKDILKQNWAIFYSKDSKGKFNPTQDYYWYNRKVGSVYSLAISYRF